VTDAEHVLVAGPSGGGKTTYLREMHAVHEGASAFLTPKTNERKAFDNTEYEQLSEGVYRRARVSSASYPRDIERTRKYAKQRSDSVQVIVDEAQQAPSFIDGRGPVKNGLHEDRSAGVKWVIATQSPSDLRTNRNGYGPIQQCKFWVWCGPLKTWHEGFFQSNGMSDMIDHMPENNYEYVVIDPTASLSAQERIVSRGKTNPKFG
jgi:energy-coupling factor transporter ATP-binding protein EcfA2